jgi:hypothetical protein
VRRKKVDETAPRVIQEEVECFVKSGSLGNQLSGDPSKMRIKNNRSVSLRRRDTYTENRKLVP